MNIILLIAIGFIVLAVFNFKNVNKIRKPAYVYEKVESQREHAQKEFQKNNPQLSDVTVLYSPDWRHNWSFTTHGIYYCIKNNEGRITGKGFIRYENITEFFFERVQGNDNFFDMCIHHETEKGPYHARFGVVTEYTTLTMDKLQVFIRQATVGGEV